MFEEKHICPICNNGLVLKYEGLYHSALICDGCKEGVFQIKGHPPRNYTMEWKLFIDVKNEIRG